MPRTKADLSAPKISAKSINISARISQDDAEFLAQYKSAGCITPSDKLRAILAEVRERQIKLQDFRGSIDVFSQMLAPISAQLRELERVNQLHSALMSRVLAWLPDLMAYVVACENQLSGEVNKQQLIELEAAVADKVFRLMESIMQMGVIKKSACYDENAISSRIDSVLDIAKVIRS